VTRSLLLSCEAVGKAYGTRSLFEGLSFGLFEGDQVGLVTKQEDKKEKKKIKKTDIYHDMS